jgi:hypothetical protein
MRHFGEHDTMHVLQRSTHIHAHTQPAAQSYFIIYRQSLRGRYSIRYVLPLSFLMDLLRFAGPLTTSPHVPLLPASGELLGSSSAPPPDVTSSAQPGKKSNAPISAIIGVSVGIGAAVLAVVLVAGVYTAARARGRRPTAVSSYSSSGHRDGSDQSGGGSVDSRVFWVQPAASSAASPPAKALKPNRVLPM